MGSGRKGEKVIPTLMSGFQNQLRQGGMTDNASRALAEEFGRSLTKENVSRVIAQALSERFTEDELKELAALRQTPLGVRNGCASSNAAPTASQPRMGTSHGSGETPGTALGPPGDGEHPSFFRKETVMDAATSLKRPEPWNKGKLIGHKAELRYDDCLFPSRVHGSPHIGTRQYARMVHGWVDEIGLDTTAYGTHTMRRTKASMIYKKTKNLRAVQIHLGHTKLESTVRYLGIEVDDALDLAEQLEV
jgi:hypothetical protein